MAVGAAEETETDCRQEEEKGHDEQQMPVAEGDAARVGQGRGLWFSTSSHEGGFMPSERSSAAPIHPRVRFSSQVSLLKRNATDLKKNQRRKLHLDHRKIKEWVDIAPLDSSTKA